MDELERRYRRLMRAYPAGYRREREEEIVATLLDAAPPGRSRPTAADAADILVAGVRTRFGALGTGEPGLALRTAAPVALAVAAGIALLGLLRDSEATAGHPSPFRPALPAYLAWLLAVAGRVALPAVLAWVLSGIALLGTLAALAAMPWTWSSPSPGWSLVLLALLGAVAVLGGGERISGRERGVLAAGAVLSAAVLGGSALVVPDRSGERWFASDWAVLSAYQSPVEAVAAATLALLLAGMAIVARRRGRHWRVATLILLAATGWLLVPSFSGGGERLVRGAVIVLSVAAAIWVPRRTAGSGAPAEVLRTPAVLALGTAAGLAAAALVIRPQEYYSCSGGPGGVASDCVRMQQWITQGRPAYVAWLAAMLAWAVLPRLAGRIAVAVAVVATPAVLWPQQWDNPAPDNVMPLTLSALGIVTLLCSAGPARRADRWGVLAAAAGMYLLPMVLTLLLQPGYFTALPGPWFPVAFVPFTVALATGWWVAGRTSGATSALAVAAAALSAAWAVVVAFEVGRYPVVAALLAAAAAVAVLLRALARPEEHVPTALSSAPT
ncbi:hypothetical protein [Phytohabitans houttuyneae]|uniref:Uncharacterized protein n=1 Tax=Phytohabitans houttuyneae TaxID=1076126 RepID=A0A6V8KBC7_9ACTN|nr:hypothetical protein [Phytohabitans houttuyneae]GFJ82542.1 hypothetical protein Phou_067220 [Phytohabitans houttuyneae]